jgi:hypothetical protein
VTRSCGTRSWPSRSPAMSCSPRLERPFGGRPRAVSPSIGRCPETQGNTPFSRTPMLFRGIFSSASIQRSTAAPPSGCIARYTSAALPRRSLASYRGTEPGGARAACPVSPHPPRRGRPAPCRSRRRPRRRTPRRDRCPADSKCHHAALFQSASRRSFAGDFALIASQHGLEPGDQLFRAERLQQPVTSTRRQVRIVGQTYSTGRPRRPATRALTAAVREGRDAMARRSQGRVRLPSDSSGG